MAALTAALALLAACSDAPAPSGPAGATTTPAAADPGLPGRLAQAVSGQSATTHLQALEPVSYTHLTLPTNSRV